MVSDLVSRVFGRSRFLSVFAKEFNATFRLIPLVLGGMVTPLFIYFMFGRAMGAGQVMIAGVPLQQYMVPGTLFFQLVYSTFYQASYSTFFSSNITQTMDELLTSPLSSLDILMGRVANTTVVSILVTIPLLGILVAVSGIGIHLGWLVVSLAALFLVAVISSLLGTLLGLMVNNEFSLINFANVIVIPLIFLSDTFIRVSDHPVANALLYLSPVKLGNDVVRRGLIQHELDLVGSGLLMLYAVVWGVIVYRVFDAKSRG